LNVCDLAALGPSHYTTMMNWTPSFIEQLRKLSSVLLMLIIGFVMCKSVQTVMFCILVFSSLILKVQVASFYVTVIKR